MTGRRSRRGNASLVFLIVLPVLVLVLLLVLRTGQLEQSRGEVQQVADAAALAAGLTLVDDTALLPGSEARLQLLQRGREEARRYARANPVLGTPTELNPNEANAPEGDIVFGLADSPTESNPQPADLQDPLHLSLINTVRISVVRSRARGSALNLIGGTWFNSQGGDITRIATAYLDRRVVGLRQVGEKPMPLVPLALLSAPGNPSERESWESQVEHKAGTDDFSYRLTPSYQFDSSKGDGLHEMTVRLSSGPVEGDQPGPNCLVLNLGKKTQGPTSELAQQVRSGVQGSDLILGPDGRLPVQGTPFGPLPGSLAFTELVGALTELRDSGEVRVWPLFDSAATASYETPIVSGFVAARVMAVGTVDQGGLRFLLQPACLASVNVVTQEAEMKHAGQLNRYICKVRLID